MTGRDMMGKKTNAILLPLDPRTKIFLTVTTTAIMLIKGSGGLVDVARIMLSVIPFVLLVASRRIHTAVIYASLFAASFVTAQLFGSMVNGFPAFLLFGCFYTFTRILPGIMMGYLTVSTTTVSEFTASMERMHLPQQIIIPISVMFRFFPTVKEEMAAINDAMRMRGITFLNPMKMLEYRLIPMMICSVKIGEELSAAALTRGLGSPVKRTNVCKVGFCFFDIFALAICLFGFSALCLSNLL
jgi:energy-coupling factor transport system permease protein